MAEDHSGRPPPEAFHTVDDPGQARLLSEPESFKYFEPFVDRERTVSEAARELGCKLDTMLYRVKTFLRAGLLHVPCVTKRAGRPIKHYRSIAEAFFVPFELTPYSGTEERLEEQMQPANRAVIKGLARYLRESGWEGRRIYRSKDGNVWSESALDAKTVWNFEDPALPAAIQFSTTLSLTSEGAKRLQLDLYQLQQRYSDQPRDTGRSYLLQIAFLPAVPES